MEDIRIVPTDEQYVASLHLALDTIARERRYLILLEAPPVDAVRGFIRALVGGAGVQVLAIDAAETVVGWCDIIKSQPEGFRHTGRLGMGVLQRFRGKGIGRELAAAAIERAWSLGLTRIELEVFASNEPAVSLYRSLGFAVEGVKRRARVLDGVSDDIVVMALLEST